MKTYLGKEILVNNFIFLLTVPLSVIIGNILAPNAFFGGFIEALYTQIILIILFFVYLNKRMRKIKKRRIRLLYSYFSCVTYLFLIIFLFVVPPKTESIFIIITTLGIFLPYLSSLYIKKQK